MRKMTAVQVARAVEANPRIENSKVRHPALSLWGPERAFSEWTLAWTP